ncbi:MAG: YceI family protein [Anaerolineae bacterium]|nr:YceI family protein [Anaerolineae bacterium]
MSWQIDNTHTHIQFSTRHMMISTVRGEFEQFSGSVALDENNPENTSVEIQIDVNSINTRVEDRDNHLKSPDFFNAAKYPHITFRSTRVERTGEGSARLHGDLIIRDVTRPVALDVNYLGQAKSPWGATSAGFTGKTTINRKDWGLTWNQALETGGVLVGEDITIEIELELVKQAEGEAVA